MVALATWLLDCLSIDVTLGTFHKMDLGGSWALVDLQIAVLALVGISRRKLYTFMFLFIYFSLLFGIFYVLGGNPGIKGVGVNTNLGIPRRFDRYTLAHLAGPHLYAASYAYMF